MKKIFTKIYQDKIWFKGSGSGSSPTNTVLYRHFLQSYLSKNNIRSVIDVGCGDWKFSRLINWKDINYLGLDVVDAVISSNVKKYQNDKIKFKCADAQRFEFPKTDLVIIKDVFQHWPNQAINAFLPKLKKFKHILITDTCDGERANQDISDGQMRPLALNQEPFKLNAKNVFQYRTYRPIKKIYETKCVYRLFF